MGDVRALGLMVAAELTRADGSPDAARTSAVHDALLEAGHVIFMSCGTDANVVRFMPPLVVSESEIETALDSRPARRSKRLLNRCTLSAGAVKLP